MTEDQSKYIQIACKGSRKVDIKELDISDGLK